MPGLLPRNVLSLKPGCAQHQTGDPLVFKEHQTGDPQILFSKCLLIHLDFTTREINFKKEKVFSSPLIFVKFFF